MNRISKIRNLMIKNNLDIFIIHGGEHMGHNRFWLYGLEATAGFGIITSSESFFLIDGRYYEMAKEKINNATVELITTGNELIEKLVQLDGKRIGIESEYSTTNFYESLKNKLIEKEIVITNTKTLRMIKDSKEIKLIKKACSITEEVLEVVVNNIRPGMSENDIKKMLMIEHIKRGTDGIEFEIVASGVRGALPHGRASNKIIQEGEMITIDVGTSFKGYCSDITRTFVIGNKCKHEELLRIYEIVKEAQRLGIESIKPGVLVSDVDKACRDYIQSQGYGKEFCHSTGHGLGIEVHEHPSINLKSTDILEPGMVITIEPGIYIPQLGGVRIEDDVLVTNTGYEILNSSSKELKYIKN